MCWHMILQAEADLRWQACLCRGDRRRPPQVCRSQAFEKEAPHASAEPAGDKPAHTRHIWVHPDHG